MSAPTAAQIRWREQVREMGSIISGGPAVVHHIFGRTCKVKGVGNIGHWALLPLTDEEHRFLHGQATGGSRPVFEARYGTQKELFAEVVKASRSWPFEEHVYQAIMNYRK